VGNNAAFRAVPPTQLTTIRLASQIRRQLWAGANDEAFRGRFSKEPQVWSFRETSCLRLALSWLLA